MFFPEQRKFFLQDSDIFEFGGLEANGKPFFSRRIGIGASGEQLDLEAGGKLTGTIGGWNVGALAVQQSGGGISSTGQPTSDSKLFVGRASVNVLDQSSVGAIVTHGNPSSDTDNSLIGMDFNYLNTQSLTIYNYRGPVMVSNKPIQRGWMVKTLPGVQKLSHLTAKA